MWCSSKQIEKIALELAHVAFKESIEIETNGWIGQEGNMINL